MCRSPAGIPTPGYALALELQQKIARIPGAVDVHVHQVVDYPEIRVNVDRNKAGQVGLSQSDVANSLLISLSGTGQIAPGQWLNWDTGVQYFIGAQTPQRKIDSLDALMRTPIAPLGKFADRGRRRNRGSAAVGASPSQTTLAYGNPGAGADATQHLANVATTARGVAPQIVNHYNVQPVFDVYANVDRQDLGSVGAAVQKIMDEAAKKMPEMHDARSARADRHHADFLLPAGPGTDLRDHAGLLPDGAQFPVVAGSVHHSDGPAGRAGGDSLDVVRHPDDLQRAFADGRDHVYRRRHRQQYSGGGVRQRSETGRNGRARRRAGRRGRPASGPC